MNSAGSALSWKRWWRSAGFAWAGIAHSYRTQPNFRIETWAAVLALALTAWLRAPLAPIALACALVLALELVNTAVEAVVDLVSPEPHPLAGVAKDAAAAAVLLASLGAVVVGLAVLGPPLWAWVSRL
ncbi:diacylglycerol kinase [Deinococcus radiodurans]|uniref:Diacylglycerol kinase n=1 Tax=Deinococcus radiodurans (strain ATCC 13939 / DSM 20539 / JCM 16871 / CCUG 27074 / LMG 4051 / NBRC 15346 / NCIMB 9279 / VKM B-1422 / R1) TaxID=243230 RepID=Q9RSN1_DEIRA|nr:diacylglycerol kinase [Deinococcus radiodurans]AAF11643.1 diacylglycerol kinase [Deinococcus radiodurans R1 = ATCC 13939 = DSM 20539]ANC70841.1 diacylglycerol kinase [Deinococcus radiodurans R1 = ATCC 13939 = DSM 20539]QEM71482.1 diacylglycerol kinase [Deinococcus radiodurans]QIP27804.1 diacylglycerol kinase [Deinococcus radiodurans]QIP31315.1 diacylglycerol kinase [Deinococcus radiodurans]